MSSSLTCLMSIPFTMKRNNFPQHFWDIFYEWTSFFLWWPYFLITIHRQLTNSTLVAFRDNSITEQTCSMLPRGPAKSLKSFWKVTFSGDEFGKKFHWVLISSVHKSSNRWFTHKIALKIDIRQYSG